MSQKKIVFATIGSYGDLFPYFAVGKELSSRGHHVTIATCPHYKDDVEKLGLSFAPVRPEVNPNDQRVLALATDPRRSAEFIIKELVLPHLKDSYEDISRAAQGADLLISHVLTYAVPIYGEKHKVKWASTVLQPMVFCSAYETPAFPPIPWAAKLRVFGPKFNRFFINTLKLISKSWSRPIANFRKELGLPKGKDPLWEGQHSPYLVLSLFSNAFAAPQPDWPHQARTCGFPFFEKQDKPDDPSLKKFLENGASPIVFSLGSTAVKVAGNFYEVATQAAKKLGSRAVLVCGDKAEKLKLQGLPPTILPVSWANLNSLFRKASAVVHSGGIGTTAQALQGGAPQIVVPFANDQFDNADRVERLGLGEALYRNRLSEKRLAESLNRILQDSAMKEKAQEMGQKIRLENGQARAADEIELLLKN